MNAVIKPSPAPPSSMELAYNQPRKLWEFKTKHIFFDRARRENMERVGFILEEKTGIWVTPEPAVASRLKKYASPEQQHLMQRQIEWLARHKERTTIQTVANPPAKTFQNLEIKSDFYLGAPEDTKKPVPDTTLKAFRNKTREEVTAARAASMAISSDFAVPAPEGLEYLPFQRAGVEFAVGKKNVLFGDDMGLGKTLQAIGTMNCHLQNLADRGTKPRVKALIVAPRIALIGWTRELRKWLIHEHGIGIVRPKMVGGKGPDGKRKYTQIYELPDADVMVMNYENLKKYKSKLDKVGFTFIVYDEAHALKNPKTDRTRAAFGYWDQKARRRIPAIPSQHRLFMTGTPILGRPLELWPILNACDVPEAKDWRKYTERYCDGHTEVIKLWDNTLKRRVEKEIWNADGASHVDELNLILRSSIMIRRLKKDVLTMLPERSYEVMEVPNDDGEFNETLRMEEEQLARHLAVIREMEHASLRFKSSGDMQSYRRAIQSIDNAKEKFCLEEMSKVRHATAVAKLPYVIEHIQNTLEGTDNSILVFAHHRDVIEAIVAGIKEVGVEPAVILGGMTDAVRQRAMDDIQEHRKRILVGSITACNSAVTLTEANIEIFAEQDWTPGIMRQAEDRAYRYGQKNTVLIQHLVVAGSFDAYMAKNNVGKDILIESILDTLVDVDAIIKESRLAIETADEKLEKITVSSMEF